MCCSRLAAVGSAGVGCHGVTRWLFVSCRELEMENNQLSGSIPSTLGILTALT
jgi:hypothetical protein